MDDAEMLDSKGNPPRFFPGDRVYVMPVKMEATVIEQMLSYDSGEYFWGNLKLKYDDGYEGTSHSWQVKKLDTAGDPS